MSGQTLYLNQDLVNQLSDDDIAIATSKGWNISPAKNISSPKVVTRMSDVLRSSYHITPKNYDFSQYNGSWASGSYSAIPGYSALCVFEGDMSSTTNAFQMFKGCQRLGYVDLYNTGNITDMSYMLSGCIMMVEGNFRDWDVSNVTTMKDMFYYTGNANVDISDWNVSNVISFEKMFYKSKIQTVDMSNWKHNKGSVQMDKMFADSMVENVIFGDTTNVTTMDDIFDRCRELKSITMTYPLTHLINNNNMFSLAEGDGTFYYNPEYDYSVVINQLPKGWKVVPLS